MTCRNLQGEEVKVEISNPSPGGLAAQAIKSYHYIKGWAFSLITGIPVIEQKPIEFLRKAMQGIKARAFVIASVFVVLGGEPIS